MANTLYEAVAELCATLSECGFRLMTVNSPDPSLVNWIRPMEVGDYASTNDGRIVEITKIDRHAEGATYSVIELWPARGRTDHVYVGPDHEKPLVDGHAQPADHCIARWHQREARR